jgi:AraC family transcriptional regulator
MILREFPDLNWLRKQADENFATRQGWGGKELPAQGWPSVLLNTNATSVYRDNIRGPLSIFTNISGVSSVASGKKNAVIQEDFFYLTNHDQHYTLAIDRSSSTETFNIHFGEYWADQVLASLTKSPEHLLDQSLFTAPFERLELYSKLYWRDPTVTNAIQKLKANGDQPLVEEETLYELLVHLLRQNTEVSRWQSKLPSIKNSTRAEVFRRLLTSTDYIYSYYHKDISLDELASVCCLSKFHFLRLFKSAFRKTPHQFITEIKIHHAKQLLKKSDLEIQSISKCLGFRDASSFSRTFYQHSGYYPSQFRAIR